jgi:hypothetical protein
MLQPNKKQEQRELGGARWCPQLKRDKPTLSYTILNAQRVFQTTYNLAQAKNAMSKAMLTSSLSTKF